MGMRIDIVDYEYARHDRELINAMLMGDIDDWQRLLEGKDNQNQNLQINEYRRKNPLSEDLSAKHELFCPACYKHMIQKQGKKYYICDEHWGYPDMIAQGVVKVRGSFNIKKRR